MQSYRTEVNTQGLLNMASKPERNIYKFLEQFDLPFVFKESKLPITYQDKDGKRPLEAKSDAHLPIYGTTIYFEIKDATLNNKTSKQKADNALDRIDAAKYAAKPSYYQVVHQWNHSACKFSLVEQAMSAANLSLLLIFDKQPKKTKDCDTPFLLEKYKIDYSIKETLRHDLARAIWKAMPCSPRRADGVATFHNLDTLVPLKSGEVTPDTVGAWFSDRIAIQAQEKLTTAA